MTHDEMRIAVAEEMGWYVKNKPWGDAVEWALYDPTGRCVASGHDRRPKDIPTYAAVFDCAYLPNFPADLNACAEMEKKAPRYGYYKELCKVVCGRPATCEDDWAQTVSAEAPQRCEAFLRVRGKWMDA